MPSDGNGMRRKVRSAGASWVSWGVLPSLSMSSLSCGPEVWSVPWVWMAMVVAALRDFTKLALSQV